MGFFNNTRVIYFIRHGESVLNAQGIRQGPDGPLSEKGRAQVSVVAEGLTHIDKPIEAIISSPYQRARETAEIIANRLGLPLEFSDLLVERRNPSEIVGRKRYSKEVHKIVDVIDHSYHEDNLRYSDEENFADLKARAKKLIEYIKDREEEVLLCATHGIFMEMIAAYIEFGDNLSAKGYVKYSSFHEVKNAGLAGYLFVENWFKEDEWHLWLWNGKRVSGWDDLLK